ncbi:Putative disease resistance protein RGA4 [Dendrobium catenatum]|uniref:Disease resistance protein RGA4 n=1 Tax=Dendrobium catenatum TaxID=906689 RepID=A0A2I0V957_9ASPA|nr:Putative disease resistance protein RGA4 [Dendrobium catenatum]
MFRLRDASGYGIGELENMNYLCKLGINCLENVKDAEEVCSAKLCSKRRLTDLTLSWSNTDSRNIDLDENVLDNLRPPKKLRIRGNDEVISFPNEAEQWFLRVSSSLSELEISFLKSLESLPSSLESLSSLQKLSIGPSVRMLRELPNLPPSLEYLYVRGCHPELKERYREDGGSDRHKIAHIPHISIH